MRTIIEHPRWPQDYVSVPRDHFEFIMGCYWSPLTGMYDLAEKLLAERGQHEPPWELVEELAIELSGALMETTADVMRMHGLSNALIPEESE